MTHVGKSVLIIGLLNCGLAFGQNSPAPRASATAYPVSKVQPVYSIGAKQLSKTEIQNSFATPLAGRYVVIEIGFYPAEGKTVSLAQSDFVLRTADGKDVVSPASPKTIARINQKQPDGGNDVTLYPSANVGYVSYPAYDGTGNTRRVSGPVYGVGMGVGVEKNTSAATTDSDRQTMETELRDKELQDADVSKPVAGYLYFPIPTKQKVEYQLEYRGTDTVTSLPLKVH
jgi:hypothetical protein